MKTKSGDYNAVICTLTNVQPHPNADRLLIAMAAGYQVIVGLGTKEGDIGILFPEGGRLSHEMLMTNNLYRKHPVTGEPMGGYFEESGRVRAVKLRGAESDGFFTPLDSLNWALDGKAFRPTVGLEFDHINGQQVCEKYYTPATLRRMKQAQKRYTKPWWVPKFLAKFHRTYVVKKVKRDPAPSFKQHFKTSKLRTSVVGIPEGLKVIWTRKVHGTSGRTGLVPYDKRGFLGRMLGFKIPYKYVTGTRRVVKNPDIELKEQCRRDAHERIVAAGLQKNEIIYYEILGWNGAKPIMPSHKLKWSAFKKVGIQAKEFAEIETQFNGVFNYDYGTVFGDSRIQVYRITQDGRDLSWVDVENRCMELDLDTVEYLAWSHTGEDLMSIASQFANSHSSDQLCEGVVARVEDLDGNLAGLHKYKSFLFCLAEGIQANDADYVNMEEVS